MKKIHLRVFQHEGGFFSNFNKVTNFLRQNDVAKITWHMQGQPYGAFAYNCGEVFSKLFLPYDDESKVTDIVDLLVYDTEEYTGNNVYIKYKNNDIKWRTEFNNTLRYFNPTEKLQQLISSMDLSFNKLKDNNFIGVLKRNDRLKCEQPNNTLPTLQDYFTEIDKVYDDKTYLCLSVDNTYDIQKFVDKYKRCIYNPKIRRTRVTTDEEPHFLPGTEIDAMYAYLEVVMTSKCRAFIHPVSNMATASLYFNPKQISIYI
jgi:hypothetical protein